MQQLVAGAAKIGVSAARGDWPRLREQPAATQAR